MIGLVGGLSRVPCSFGVDGGATMAVLPETGRDAPDFRLPRADGGSLGLSDLRGSPVVLFFFPKASTPG
jgi:hypothetical protein